MRRPMLLARASLAVAGSVVLHVLLGALVVGSSLWRAWPMTPVNVEITGMRLEDLQDLPLGLPASGNNKSDDVVTPAPRAPAVSSVEPTTKKDPTQPKPRKKNERDGGAQAAAIGADGGAPRPTSVRSYAPQGSRVIALLRVDRLRDTVHAAAVDALLANLPDRRDLLEGTGVDFYRDIDALLIATPNPLDARVTFLAARHRLTDTAMRAALERGARATDRKLTWRVERGRPFAERRSAGGAAKIISGAPSRDERLILLAAPHLVVVTPAAYRSLILRGRTDVRPGTRHRPDAGDATATPGDGGVGGDARESARAGDSAGDGDDPNGWAALLRRIDAEDSIMPPDGVAMISAVDLFAARSLRHTLDVVPGTRGAVDDLPAPGLKGAATGGATILGLPIPRLLNATLGVTPQPFADIYATFDDAADADRWEGEWPALRDKLRTNPLAVLSGFSRLIGRATLARAGLVMHLRVEATDLETTRILQLVAAQISALRR